MVDTVLRNPRGNHDRRDPRALLLKREAELVVTSRQIRVTGSHSGWRRNMIIETSVLVIGNNKNTALPDRGIANGFVCRFDQTFAKSDIIERMLRCAALIVVQKRIARFDKHIVVREGSLQICGKFVVFADVAKLNAL